LYFKSTKIFLDLQLLHYNKKGPKSVGLYNYPKVEGDLEHQNLQKLIY